MSDAPVKSFLTNSKLKTYSVTAGETRAKSAMNFNVYKGDFTFAFTVRKDSDPKESKGVFIPVGMDIFTAQSFLDTLQAAANAEGNFDAVTFVTVEKDAWNPETKQMTPGAAKTKLTVFKRPNGVVCIGVEDLAKQIKTDIQLIHPNSQVYHQILVNKEPATDAFKSKMYVNSICKQISNAMTIESQRTYEAPVFGANNKQGYGGNNQGYNKPQQSSYQKPQQEAPASFQEDDIPY